MKINLKLIISTTCLFIASSAIAQKAKVVSAYNYNKSYERDKECSELEKGIAAIEPATKDVKTSSWAKTWYYGGNLYFNAALTQDKECATKFPHALENTYEYYLNSMKYNVQDEASNQLNLDEEADMLKLIGYISNRETKFEDQTYFRDIIGNKFPYVANAFINKGVEYFQAGDFTKAKEYSEKSIEANMFLRKVDSLGMYNSALAAERLGEEDEALSYYTALTRIKYGGPNIYFFIANIYDKRKDTAKRIETIRKGLVVYPDNDVLIKEELSYLLATGQTDTALAKFDKAIANDPENPSLYYNRGIIYDQLDSTDKAVTNYRFAASLLSIKYPYINIMIGMSSSDLINAIGEPSKRNVTNTNSGKNEQWVYTNDLYVYIDVNNKVSSFQSSTSSNSSLPFDVIYNLGALYFNLGAKWSNEASKLGEKSDSLYGKGATALYKETTAFYKEANTKSTEYFSKARPELEWAHRIEPSDQTTMVSLVKIYAIVGDDAKYTAMKAKLQGK